MLISNLTRSAGEGSARELASCWRIVWLSMVWPTVPAGRDEVTTQWLSSVFGPVQSFTIEQIGEDFGLSGSTFKVDLRLIEAPQQQAAIKFALSGPTAREITFFEHCAPDTPLRLPRFVAGAIDQEADRGV